VRAERLAIEFRGADAEALPFEDATFDVVVSTFGVMFTPDQERAAAELVRVCKRGGKIGLANWTPEGFIGQLFKTNARHVPPPAGLRSPIQWGTEERLHELFGGAIAEIRFERRHYVFRDRSPAAFVQFWRRYYGPILKSFEAVGDGGEEALRTDLLELIGRFNRADDGTMVVPSEYLEAVIVTR
jgi:ubiquinone/menaquinone biosynthesis C-methylase UbiE